MKKDKEDKIIEMIGCLSDRMDKKIDDLSVKVDKKIDDLSVKVDKKIDDLSVKVDKIDVHTNKRIDGLAEIVATGFGEMHEKFEQIDIRLEKNDIQHNKVMNILDNHTKLLLDNRAERAATIGRMDRLEGEIIKIKRKVKIA